MKGACCQTRWFLLGLGLLLLPLTPLAAPGDGSRLSVKILQPDRGDLLFGQVVLKAEVTPPPGVRVEEVTFFVDGSPISIDREAPYEALWSLIDPLRDHLIRATALGSNGERAYDLLSIPVLGPVTRVSVTGRAPDFVLVTVTFLDENGHPLVDIQKDEVLVLEEEEPQIIDVFAPDDRPLAAELLLDASGSTQPFWEKLSQSTRLFAETMRPGDRAGVEAFNNNSFPLAPLGSSPEEIELATSSFQDWGGVTRLYDAMSRGALLHLGREETRRRALVVLTDAADFGSTLTAVDTDEYLRRGEVQVHAVLLETAAQRMSRGAVDFRAARNRLAGIAARTGGMHYDDPEVPMEEIFVRIGELLRAQYILGFYSISRRPPGKERRLEVRLLRDGDFDVRVRRAHFGGETLGEYLAAEMSRGPERRRITAIRTALLSQDAVAIGAMVDALTQGKDTSSGVPREARLGLISLGAEAVPFLREALRPTEKRRMRQLATGVLVDLLARLSRADDPAELDRALVALGNGDAASGRGTVRGFAETDLSERSRERLDELLGSLHLD